jgi:glycosyltransferase involved in cell wall biosynthesis
MKRVLLLNNIPAPYFTPLFEQVAEDSGWDLTVAYNSSWNSSAGWASGAPETSSRHETIILDRQRPRLTSTIGSNNSAAIALANHVIRNKPDYLICYGYTQAPQALAIEWANVTSTPFAISGDANCYLDTLTGVKRIAKTSWLRHVVRSAAALITIGSANRLFWESYGATPEQLFEARFAVDNDFYAEKVVERRPEAVELRRRLGLNDGVVFLSVGRLVQRKGIDLMIRAARSMPGEAIGVVVAGDGEERATLEAIAEGDNRIVFAGRVSPGELPVYYAMADVLVLAAQSEPWGLVINEAMASGLAIIAHRHCGATLDLVGPDNGVVLEGLSERELAGGMQFVASDLDRLSRMKIRSQEKIAGWSIAGAARGIVRAVEESSRPGAARTLASGLERSK